jgi:uncharacterized delta-60 repeat protein
MKKSTSLLAICMLFINMVSFSQAGSLDSSFGRDGKVTTKAPSDDTFGNSVAIQADQKIVVAGYVYNGLNYDFALVRYEPNGKRDIDFGTKGKVSADFGGDDIGHSVAIQADGKIVVAGSAFDGIDFGFALARYKSNGALDSSFGRNGKVITGFGGYAEGVDVAIQADGKIVVSGYCDNGPYADFALTRYEANGRLDSSFGLNGKVISDFNGREDNGLGSAIQSNGKIVVAGYASDEFDGDLALIRYKSNGKPDSSFGVNGKVTTDFGSFSYDIGYSVAIQADGKIVVGGLTDVHDYVHSLLARYKPNGTPDSSFADNGKLEGRNPIYSIAIQSDG